jgi:WD40 repeat protein
VQPVEAIAISSDGKRLVTGSRDHSARVWSVESQSVEHFFYGHTAAVREVAWDETERFVLTLSIDGQVLVWDSETGRRISRLRSTSEAILQAEFLHGSTLVVTSTSSGAVRVWNAVTGNVVYTYADTNPTTSTFHLLSDESTGVKSLLAVSKNGFIQQRPANIEKRSMDDKQLGRFIQRMTSDDSDLQ